MDANLKDSIGPDDLANVIVLSLHHFKRSFKKTMGMDRCGTCGSVP